MVSYHNRITSIANFYFVTTRSLMWSMCSLFAYPSPYSSSSKLVNWANWHTITTYPPSLLYNDACILRLLLLEFGLLLLSYWYIVIYWYCFYHIRMAGFVVVLAEPSDASSTPLKAHLTISFLYWKGNKFQLIWTHKIIKIWGWNGSETLLFLPKYCN